MACRLFHQEIWAFIRSQLTQIQRPWFCPKSLERTNTKFTYLTYITQSIVRARRSSAHKAHIFRLYVVCRTLIGIWKSPSPVKLCSNSLSKNWVESRSGSRADSVLSVSDFLHCLRKHWQMWHISRRFPQIVVQDTKWQDMGQLQGPIRSGLQGGSKILKNFKDQRLRSARARCTSKRRTFHQNRWLSEAT